MLKCMQKTYIVLSASWHTYAFNDLCNGNGGKSNECHDNQHIHCLHETVFACQCPRKVLFTYESETWAFNFTVLEGILFLFSYTCMLLWKHT